MNRTSLNLRSSIATSQPGTTAAQARARFSVFCFLGVFWVGSNACTKAKLLPSSNGTFSPGRWQFVWSANAREITLCDQGLLTWRSKAKASEVHLSLPKRRACRLSSRWQKQHASEGGKRVIRLLPGHEGQTRALSRVPRPFQLIPPMFMQVSAQREGEGDLNLRVPITVEKTVSEAALRRNT